MELPGLGGVANVSAMQYKRQSSLLIDTATAAATRSDVTAAVLMTLRPVAAVVAVMSGLEATMTSRQTAAITSQQQQQG